MPKYKITSFLKKDKTLSNDQHPIYIRINRGNSRTLIRLKNLTSVPGNWDDDKGLYIAKKKLNPNYHDDNNTITKEIIKVSQIIDNFEDKKTNWTFAKVKKAYGNDHESKRYSDYLKNRIVELDKNEQYSAANTRKKIIPLLTAYMPEWKTYHFADFDTDFVEGFINFMKVKKGYSGNTISHYNRALRADFNRAINKGYGSANTYPFSNKYHNNEVVKPDSLKCAVINKHISKDLLNRFRNYSLDDIKEQYIRSIFFFTFFSQGINFKDLALLTNDSIKTTSTGKIIQYTRAKTGKQVSFPLIKPLEAYIDWLRDYRKPLGNYLLPIITRNSTGKKLHTHIQNRGNWYNNNLKNLIKKIDLSESLLDITSYYARHSFAQICKENGVPIERISEMLGHESTITTKIYLRSLDANANAVINASLLD